MKLLLFTWTLILILYKFEQETMASGSSMDTSSHAKPGSLPIYPSSSVTVHVPYTSNHGQVSSPTIQHRQTAPGIKVGQTTAVIQKASPAPLPSIYL